MSERSYQDCVSLLGTLGMIPEGDRALIRRVGEIAERARSAGLDVTFRINIVVLSLASGPNEVAVHGAIDDECEDLGGEISTFIKGSDGNLSEYVFRS